MKHYAAIMTTGISKMPNLVTQWIEVTDEQHNEIIEMLMQNKKRGMEELP